MATPTASAAPKRSAWRRLSESRVRFEREGRGDGAAGPSRSARRAGAVDDDPDEQRPEHLGEAADRAPEQRRQASPAGRKRPWATSRASATERPKIASRSEYGEAVAGEGADQGHRQHRQRRRLAGEDAERGRRPRSAAPRRPARRRAARPARRARGSRRTGRRWRSRPWSARRSRARRSGRAPTGTAIRAPRRSAGPGSAGADREQRRGAQPRAVPAALKSRLAPGVGGSSA